MSLLMSNHILVDQYGELKSKIQKANKMLYYMVIRNKVHIYTYVYSTQSKQFDRQKKLTYLLWNF